LFLLHRTAAKQSLKVSFFPQDELAMPFNTARCLRDELPIPAGCISL